MALAIGIRKVGRKEAKTPRRCRKRTSEEERRRVSARQQKKILLLLLFTFFRPRLRRQSAPGLKKQNPVFSPSPSRVSFSLFDPSSDARESSRALSEIFHWFSGAKKQCLFFFDKKVEVETKPETQIVHSFPVGREEGSLAFLQRQRVFSRLLARALSFSRQQQQQRLCPSASMASQRRTVRWVFFFFSSSISLSLSPEKELEVFFSFFRLLLATFLLCPSPSLPPPPPLLLLFFPPQQRSENSLQRSAIGF